MPPKTKFTKEQLIDTAFAIAQEEGFSAITIRKVAHYLGCSIAPIYVNFTDVTELKEAVLEKVLTITQNLIAEQNTGDKFLDIGVASVLFAKRYPLLYDELALRDKQSSKLTDELNLFTLTQMKEDSELASFSEAELKLLLIKMKALQSGLSILAQKESYRDALPDETIIHLLQETGADFIEGMKKRTPISKEKEITSS